MKPIAHYEDRYLIGDNGMVLSLASNSYLALVKNPNGYLKVSLANGDGSNSQRSIHTLVAKHFLPNPYGHPQVNHINGDKELNLVSNLEWCTAEHNINEAFRIGLRPGYMSMDDKLLLVGRVLKGDLIRDLATEFNRPETGLSGMLRRAADKSNQRPLWDIEMKRRRKDVAIRNLAKINN